MVLALCGILATLNTPALLMQNAVAQAANDKKAIAHFKRKLEASEIWRKEAADNAQRREAELHAAKKELAAARRKIFWPTADYDTKCLEVRKLFAPLQATDVSVAVVGANACSVRMQYPCHISDTHVLLAQCFGHLNS